MLRAAILIAFITGAIFFLTSSNRLVFVNDEGLYLDGAMRILHGEVPYRDFFAITGPGTFWLLAALFRVFGVSLESARLLRALDLAVMTGITYWIAARLGRRWLALFSALLFAALATGLPNGLGVNHRWEGSAFALAGVAAGILLMERPSWYAAAATGALSILGAWCTPSLGLVSLVIGAWILWNPKLRHTAFPFAGGALVAALLPAAALDSQGALVPMLQAMGWNSARYSLANRIMYGSLLGSPFDLLATAHVWQKMLTALFLFTTLLPAILPPLAMLMWLPALRSPRRPEVFLLLCGVALVGSSLPRWDLMHLLYVAPVFVVLVALWLERHVNRLTFVAVAIATLIPATVMAAMNLAASDSRELVDTPVGKVKASPADARQLRMFIGRIRPGDTLFVFPYQAMFYFVTAGRNPTQYSFVQPGMMSSDDERTIAAQLKANPPEWVLDAEFPPEYYLRIWPSSNPADLKMPVLEGFIHDNYALWPDVANDSADYRLLKRKPASEPVGTH